MHIRDITVVIQETAFYQQKHSVMFARVKRCNSTKCQTKYLISEGPDALLHNFKRLI